MALQKWSFTVALEEGSLRLDQLISVRTGLSRRKAREALQLGGVQVAKTRVRVAGRMLKPGTEVRVAFDETLGGLPELILEIVHEDAWLLAVNKPAGLPTQGTWASDRHDVLALLRRQRPDLQLFLQHRLDQGTSGLLLFSKDPAVNAPLTKQFTEHTLRKTYLARVASPCEACVVELPIGRLRGADPGRYACAGDLLEPKPARTAFRPATAEEAAGLHPAPWVVAEPATGRTHQIRVHLAHLGKPVHGDRLYGGAADPQMWLHAWKLELDHPGTGLRIELIAPPTRFLESTR
ncbi:MAG: RluA family pseudouridine synthase [Holophagaceae bacterium]|nr:RluA family pseudouridine synthase [Holophagaceae bacterium]